MVSLLEKQALHNLRLSFSSVGKRNMSILDDVMLKQIKYIVLMEHRPFSHLDFCSKKVNGQPYAMTHGTYRNKISRLMKLGIVESEYNAGTAFHTLTGVHFGKRKMTMTPSMTPNHMGVSSVTNVTEDNDATKLPIYQEIQKLPPEKQALHDIHLKFHVPDIWTIIASSKKYDSELL